MSELDFPYHFDGRGRTARHRREEHIRDLIEQVLFTSPGERVMRPDFGSGLLAHGLRTQQHGAGRHHADADPGRAAAAPRPSDRGPGRGSRSRSTAPSASRCATRCSAMAPAQRGELRGAGRCAMIFHCCDATPARSAAPLGHHQERHRVPRGAGSRRAARRAARSARCSCGCCVHRRVTLTAGQHPHHWRRAHPDGRHRVGGAGGRSACHRRPSQVSSTGSTNCRARWWSARPSGDFSRYTLRTRRKPRQRRSRPTDFDPLLSRIDFSFKVECPSDFDCAAPLACAPAASRPRRASTTSPRTTRASAA